MFESLERKLSPPPETNVEQAPEMEEPIVDGLAGMGNARSRTLAEIERASHQANTPEAERKLRSLKVRRKLLEIGLEHLKRLQEKGITALDL